jgi:hypothetical protein
MFGGVFVFRLIAAPHATATQACPQVKPRLTHGNALIADISCRLDGLDQIEMRALVHGDNYGRWSVTEKGSLLP